MASARDAAANHRDLRQITVGVDGHDQRRDAQPGRRAGPRRSVAWPWPGWPSPRPCAEVAQRPRSPAPRRAAGSPPPVPVQGVVGAGARRQAVDELHGAIEQQAARLGGPRHRPQGVVDVEDQPATSRAPGGSCCCALSRSSAATRACQAVAATPATSVSAGAAATATSPRLRRTKRRDSVRRSIASRR